MTRRRLIAIGGAVAVLAAAGLALSIWRVGGEVIVPPVAPTAVVPVAWKEARLSDGHSAHLGLPDVACDDCHDIDQAGFEPPTKQVCARCHTEVVSTIHENSPLGNDDCLTCHGFGTDRSVEPKKCLRCHDRDQGFVQAIEVHSGADCTGCHDPHGRPSLRPRTCTDCHEEQATRHAGREIAGTQACTDCHQAHGDKAAADRRCLDCHRDDRALTGVHPLFAGHDKCTGCHQPHDFSRAGVKSCRTCHSNLPVLAAAGVVEPAGPIRGRADHRRCASCHTPHDPARAGDATCAGCHRTVKPNHPAHQGERCLGCHPPHAPGMAAGVVAAACSSCHKEAASDRAFHAAGKTRCADCHQAHAFTAVAAGGATCARCHADQVRLTSATRGHDDCVGCHAQGPHAPAAPPTACGSCHRTERVAVRTGHQDCRGCHEPHGGGILPKKNCAGCHDQVAASAPRGHSDCRSCHEQHSGSLKAGSTCASCHADRTGGHHGGIKGGCATCHRPHGPEGAPGPGLRGPARPPSCTTCHKPASLPGLHQQPEHRAIADCKGCHAPHEAAPSADRATCLSCHTAQQNHEPAARVCNGCHVFKRAGP